MALDVGLLRTSFETALERQPDLTHQFYGELFHRYPQAKSLFAQTRMEVQERMLAEALVAVMAHLEDGEWLQSQLGQLGAKHAGYGVTEEMYGWVGESLVATLGRANGSDWSPAHDMAWQEACGAVASLMLAGYPQTEAV